MVNNKTIDARILSRMFLAGAKNLEAKKEWINELNVFPVPDGDTGTNMTMTIMAAAAEVGSLGEPDMETLAKAISSGSLRGARGNSGVILSQLLRGFTRSVKNSKELDAIDIAAAMEKGVETAYKAVMKPKEGCCQGCRACGDSRGSGYIFPERDRSCGGNSGKDTGDAAGSERSRSSGFRWTGTSGSIPWCI